jgi:hypothetical protein
LRDLQRWSISTVPKVANFTAQKVWEHDLLSSTLVRSSWRSHAYIHASDMTYGLVEGWAVTLQASGAAGIVGEVPMRHRDLRSNPAESKHCENCKKRAIKNRKAQLFSSCQNYLHGPDGVLIISLFSVTGVELKLFTSTFIRMKRTW